MAIDKELSNNSKLYISIVKQRNTFIFISAAFFASYQLTSIGKNSRAGTVSVCQIHKTVEIEINFTSKYFL